MSLGVPGFILAVLAVVEGRVLLGMSVEERLSRLEALLVEVLERLRRIEESLGEAGEAVSLAVRLVAAFSMPAVKALEAAQRVVALRGLLEGMDPISLAVVEALSDCEPRGVTEIERRVRVLRGRASRRIIRGRLERLVERGVVVRVGGEGRPRYTLATCRGG